MEQLLSTIVDLVWGLPLVIFLFAANLYLMVISKFKPLLSVGHAVSLLWKEKDKEGEGQISHFQTFCNAIAATVGLGNISGVAIAISQGGPGVVLWMWIAAFFGMNTKFFEVSTALLLRGKDHLGEAQGGAMYSIEKTFSKNFKFLGMFFAICGTIGTLSMFQINQLASMGSEWIKVDGWIIGVIFSLLTLWVLRGGLIRLSKACSIIVPVMSVVYIVSAIIILGINSEKIIPTLIDIFKHALGLKTAIYGTMSYGFIHIMVTGIKRATFSNEAGLGTAPMAHSNSKTNQPISEGYVSMLGPLLDTLIVCTLTALVVLVSADVDKIQTYSGINLTLYSFEKNLGEAGKVILGISVLLFGYSTILGMANYNQKCWDFVFKGRKYFGKYSFQAWYIGTIVAGSILTVSSVINIIDIAYALMTIPNIAVTVYMAKEVNKRLIEYNKKLKL